MADAEKNRVIHAPLPPKEVPVQIARFSPEVHETLINNGYFIYPLTGKSIEEQQIKDGRLWFKSHENLDSIIALQSDLTEVAINPKQLFLPNSGLKTLEEQIEMVRLFSELLSQDIQGVKAIIGGAADYVELVLSHRDNTGKHLFAKPYHFTRTLTPVDESNSAIVGYNVLSCGLKISYCDPNIQSPGFRVTPLVVPAQEE